MLMENFNSLQTEEQERRLAALASKALACWNIKDAELALIKYRENAVYKVSDRSSKVCYALRVHRYGYHNDDELLSELAWMETINKVVSLPRRLFPVAMVSWSRSFLLMGCQNLASATCWIGLRGRL